MNDCSRVHISLIIFVVLTDRNYDFDNEFNDHSFFEMNALSFDHCTSHFVSSFVSILFDRIQLMKIILSHVKKFESTLFIRRCERVTIEALFEEFIFWLFFFECSLTIKWSLSLIELRWLDFKCFCINVVLFEIDVIE